MRHNVRRVLVYDHISTQERKKGAKVKRNPEMSREEEEEELVKGHTVDRIHEETTKATEVPGFYNIKAKTGAPLIIMILNERPRESTAWHRVYLRLGISSVINEDVYS